MNSTMKKFFTSLFLCLGLLLATNSYAMFSKAPAANDPVATNVNPEAKLGIDDLKNMTVKEIEAKIGHELTWKQKLGIKMLKNKAAKAERHPEKPAASGSTLIGLLLGLVLFLIGVLIAYIAFADDRNVIKGAWIGAAVVLVLYLVVL